MKKSEIPKVITLRSLLIVFFIGFGVLISMQIRSIPVRVTDPVAPYTSLKETKQELTDEQGQLKDEIESLRNDIQVTQKQQEQNVLTDSEIKAISLKKAKAGVTKLNGGGVIVQLDDSKSGGVSEESIVHAADIRDVINLLWSYGAEGISLNNQRIVQGTAIDCIVNTILVNNIRLTNPFRIEAIGSGDVLFQKLSDTSYLTNLHDRQKAYGLVFSTELNKDITLPVYSGTFDVATGVK
jgi:uncharacterized protein YlxW (UPF0749 family)